MHNRMDEEPYSIRNRERERERMRYRLLVVGGLVTFAALTAWTVRTIVRENFRSYAKYRSCEEVKDREPLDFSQEKEMVQFEVKAQEGCWGGWITPPQVWTTFFVQTKERDGWWALWGEHLEPIGPFRSAERPPLNYSMGAPFRLQGTGRILVFTDMKKTHIQDNKPEKQAVVQKPHVEPEIERERKAPANAEPPKEKGSPPGTVKELDRMYFTLGDCLRDDGGYVRCYYTITNRREERELNVGTGSRLFDADGHEHKMSDATIGSEKVRFGVYVTNRIPPEVAIAATIGFSGVPEHHATLRLVELHTNLRYATPAGRIQFYNVPIKKAKEE